MFLVLIIKSGFLGMLPTPFIDCIHDRRVWLVDEKIQTFLSALASCSSKVSSGTEWEEGWMVLGNGVLCISCGTELRSLKTAGSWNLNMLHGTHCIQSLTSTWLGAWGRWWSELLWWGTLFCFAPLISFLISFLGLESSWHWWCAYLYLSQGECWGLGFQCHFLLGSSPW